MARPPLSSERLKLLDDGRLVYEFKRAWRDGTSRAVFTPLEFIEKLVPLVPKPRAHTVRYSGVLGPAAKWRPAVVPSHARGLQSEAVAMAANSPEAPVTPPAEGIPRAESACPRSRNYAWAELMRRVCNLLIRSV